MWFVISELCWPAGVSLLRDQAPTLYEPRLFADVDRMFSSLADCEALIVRNQTLVNAALLAQAPVLKVVGRMGVGLDNLDLPALRARGVRVVTGGPANAISVAEYVFAAVFELARNIAAASASTHAGGWERQTFTGMQLHGKTFGLLGLGDIGARVARRAAAFGMRVVAFDPVQTPAHFAASELGVELLPLEHVLRCADVLSLHVPLIASTRNLLNSERLGWMKPTAFVINSARGGIIDEHALAAGLRANRLGGAALDVRAQEPPAKPDFLGGVPHLLLTPHVAGLTEEAQALTCGLVAADVLRVLAGEAPHFEVR